MTGLLLRIRCCDCDRIAEISLPTDGADLTRQLATQRWSLVPVTTAPKPAVVELLCPVCEEARWRC